MPKKPNLLFIITDQQRFDAIGRVQNELPQYKNKTRIQTPNLDRLSKEGTYFKKAYTQCAVCAPVRTVLRTGCTVERTGAQSNDLVQASFYNRMDIFKNKIEKLETFEQILVEEFGYVAEYYGKWHMPKRFLYQRKGEDKVIRYNSYNWANDIPVFSEQGEHYNSYLEAFSSELTKECGPGQQINTYSGYPYSPIQNDSRFGMPVGTPLLAKTKGGKFLDSEVTQPNVMGKDSLGEKYTPSYFQGMATVKAIDRLAKEGAPFVLTASFHNPHAPMVATAKYFDKYWPLKDKMYVPSSCTDEMENSAYKDTNGRKDIKGLDQEEKIKEWMVPYYGLCEEIDVYVGMMLERLDYHGLTSNTMVVFLSDHGEMLGAHGMREKNIFLEESARVPLFIKFPTMISPYTVVESPVSTLDIFSTILDYMGASAFDKGDGRSLRRFIENTNVNENFDEEVVITEWDFRDPTEDGKSLMREFGGETNFLVVKDSWKLMMTKNSLSKRIDMMYDLTTDPQEMNNLIGLNGATASDDHISKAEYLRALLLEWMLRMDGTDKNFTDPIHNAGQGKGDHQEIQKRTLWRKLALWLSHTEFPFGRPVQKNKEGNYIRNEYFYLGRSLGGEIEIEDIRLVGPDTIGFSLSEFKKGVIKEGEFKRVKISYKHSVPFASTLNLDLDIVTKMGDEKIVKILSRIRE